MAPRPEPDGGGVVWQGRLEGETETAALAARIARLAEAGDAICLTGDLGAGKTVFARAFIRALGGPHEVPSPTFNLVLTYDTEAGTVWHFDLYRVEHEAELPELGLEEALDGGIVLVEWPDRLGAWLPADRLEVELRHAGEQVRLASVRAHGTARARFRRLAAA